MLWSGDPARVFAWDGIIQPSLWASSAERIHMLLRSTRGRIYRSDSHDGGRHWLPAYPTVLSNNNSGLDVAGLDGTTLVLACNPVAGNWAKRTPLSLLTSNDNGATWTRQVDLEDADGEFSYPAIIRSGVDRLDVVYTANRRTIIHREVEVRRNG
jgi:predicted neuraminidase